MSLIATLLHKPVPPIHNSAKLFDVDQYRDGLAQKLERVELSNLEYERMKAAEKARRGASRNRTLESDNRFIEALSNNQMTVLQICAALEMTEHYCRQRMKFLEAKRIVRRSGFVGGKINGPVLWALV